MPRLLVFSIFLVVFGYSSFAQTNNNSPYSYYGLGETGGLDHATLGAIGNNRLTAFDSTILNFYNPSSYNTLAKGVPLVSFGISSRLSNFTQEATKEFSSVTALHHFALAFPIHKHIGLAFGVKPYTRKGYRFSSKEPLQSDSIEYGYEGTGGANEVFVGLSADIISLRSIRWAIGVNTGYIFGATSNIRTASIVGESSGGYEKRSIQVNSFHYSLGTYINYNLNETHQLKFAGTFEPVQYLNTDYEETVFYANSITGNPNFFDTLTNLTSAGPFTLAPKYGIGLCYIVNFGAESTQNKRKSQLATHFNFSATDWTQYKDPYDGGNQLMSTSSINFGVQFIPETDVKNAQNAKFYDKLRYRAGVYNYTLPFEFGGEQLNDFGTTFGVGLPITIGNAVSSVDFGLSYGLRGVQDESVLKENYYGVNVGITISPDKADRWFRKRKLN